MRKAKLYVTACLAILAIAIVGTVVLYFSKFGIFFGKSFFYPFRIGVISSTDESVFLEMHFIDSKKVLGDYENDGLRIKMISDSGEMIPDDVDVLLQKEFSLFSPFDYYTISIQCRYGKTGDYHYNSILLNDELYSIADVDVCILPRNEKDEHYGCASYSGGKEYRLNLPLSFDESIVLSKMEYVLSGEHYILELDKEIDVKNKPVSITIPFDYLYRDFTIKPVFWAKKGDDDFMIFSLIPTSYTGILSDNIVRSYIEEIYE